MLVFLGAVAYVLWINLRTEDSTEVMLSKLPDRVEPRYPMDPAYAWWRETSVYQIYPRSFKDSDGDGIGDLGGVISKLDYLQSLGVETLWLSPFFESPQRDHGYDISNYRGIDPVYGEPAVVDSLLSEVHRRDMKIVFDLVLNHTSDQHPWFLESRSSRDNPKSDWYVWKDGNNGRPPNNWKNMSGHRSAWEYAPERDQYYYAVFLPFQPDLNMANPEVRQEMMNTMKYWLDKGVDGFRLDIFDFVFEDQEYPDNPFTFRVFPHWSEGKWANEHHKYNFHQPEVIAFARELRSLQESYPDGRFMVGEVFGSHLNMRELMGMSELDGLNLVFLFDFIHDFEFSARYFRKKAMEYEAFYPAPLVPTYVFSNHDQFRSITRLDHDPRKADVLAAFQLTMRGVPFIYQGEEIGMKTASIPLDQAQDPLSEGWKAYPEWLREASGVLVNRDNCRTPMQWNDSTSAGFSTSEDTWLPVQEDYSLVNVASQLEQPKSLLKTYQDLLWLRRDYQWLKTAAVQFVDASILPPEVFSYVRVDNGKRMQVFLNFSAETITINRVLEPYARTVWSRRAKREGSDLRLEAYGIEIIYYGEG